MAPPTALEVLKDLSRVENGDEVTVVQPKVAAILGRYLRPRGYEAKHKGMGQIDVAVFAGRKLVAAVEVKPPSERIKSNYYRQLERYMREHDCSIGIATNGRQVFLIDRGPGGDGKPRRIDDHNADLLDQAFPKRSSAMKNLTEADLKRMVVRCLDDAGFFALLRHELNEAMDEGPEPSLTDQKSAADLLPSDLRELEGKKLVPRSKKHSGVVASVQAGRVRVRSKSYTSLSSAAQDITGSSVNGRKWWRLA